MHHLGYCKFNLLCSMLYAGLELLRRDSFQLRSVQHCTAKLLSQGLPVLPLLHHPGDLSPPLGVTHLGQSAGARIWYQPIFVAQTSAQTPQTFFSYLARQLNTYFPLPDWARIRIQENRIHKQRNREQTSSWRWFGLFLIGTIIFLKITCTFLL